MIFNTMLPPQSLNLWETRGRPTQFSFFSFTHSMISAYPDTEIRGGMATAVKTDARPLRG